MGCNCGGAKVLYAVRLKDGSSPPGSPFATSQQATNAIRAAGGGSMRPVAKPASNAHLRR